MALCPERLVEAALSASQPAPTLRAAFALGAGHNGTDVVVRVRGRVVATVSAAAVVTVLGAGKAAAAMGVEASRLLRGAGLATRGFVVTKYGHVSDGERAELAASGIAAVEAGHPTPDAAGQAAASSMLLEAAAVPAGALALLLLSGGGSALTPLPPPGVSLAELQQLNACLLGCGAPIDAVNCVRKHVSAFSGGRLGAALRHAQLVTLALSDVVGDAPDVIASGPSVPDPTTFADALGVLRRHGLLLPPGASGGGGAEAAARAAPLPSPLRAAAPTPAPALPSPPPVPASVLAHLTAGAAGRLPEGAESSKATPPGHSWHCVGSSGLALEAVAAAAAAAGYAPLVVTTSLQGEAADVGRALAQLAVAVVAAVGARANVDGGGGVGAPPEPPLDVVLDGVRRLRDGGFIADVAPRFEADCAAAQCRASGTRPLCLVLGGEPTVTLGAPLPSDCTGGRNQHLALAAAAELHALLHPSPAGPAAAAVVDDVDDEAVVAAATTGSGCDAEARRRPPSSPPPPLPPRPWLLALGTDGSDGPTPAAGALATAATVARAAAVGVDAAAHLRRFDSHGFWARLEAAEALVRGDADAAAGRGGPPPLRVGRGGLITTGPTGTNVADVVVVACG